MARAFRKRKGRFVARLDREERTLLLLLFDQAKTIVEPEEGMGEPEPSGDAFTDLMRGAGMAALGSSDTGSAGAPGESGEPEEPADPALARLVPAGHRDDASIAAEFRHLTAHAVRASKTARLQAAVTLLAASGDDISLDAQQADSVLAAMTDVRLILADRLGLETEEDARALEAIDDDDPRAALAAYYDFLTWLQETLAEALLRA
jgi:uncharacterized protein DUF2017